MHYGTVLLARESADEERQRAELKALEVETLKKQILALEEEELALANERRVAEELTLEMQRLKTEKNTEAKALSLRLEKLEPPWWKKLFIDSMRGRRSERKD